MVVKIVVSPHHTGQAEYVLGTDGQVRFEILLEADHSEAVQVDLMTRNARTENEWKAQRFEATETITSTGTPATQKRLAVSMPGEKGTSIDFKLRYRVTSEDEWVWLSRVDSHATLLLLPSQDERAAQLQGLSSLAAVFARADDKLEVEVVPTSVSKTKLMLVSSVAPVQAPEYAQVSFGKPNELVHWISIERLMSFWMEPNQGRGVLNTPRDSYMVAFQRTDGLHVVMLPLSGLKNDCQSHLKTDKTSGDLIMYTKNDGEQEGRGQVVLGMGVTLAAAIDAVFEYTRQLFQRDQALTPAQCETKEVDTKWLQEYADGLFYCSWNAMYTDVSEAKLLEVIEGLDKLGVKVSGIIIDDGWQDIDDQRRWKSFVPPKDKFPNGLKGFVKTVKEKYPYIKHVGVWHALCGYWNAFAPNSWISEHYKLEHVPMRKINVPEGLNENHFVAAEDIRKLYDDFYTYLASEGITMVKCDVQAVPDDISESYPKYRRIWRDYQAAFKLAAQRHFDMRVIYCMSHVSDIFLTYLLQKNVNPPCLRNSNDFFPGEAESHAWHIFWNANNALYTSRLNCLPDWDMFETTHPQARFHGVSRCLSGGPLLITDKLKESDEHLIECMTSRPIAPTNETRVVRYAKPGVSRYPYQHFRDGQCTKVINHTYDLFTLGVFNTTEHHIRESISLNDFTGDAFKENVDEYVITRYADTKSLRCSPAKRLAPIFMLELDDLQAEIFTASPILNLTKTRQCAVLGLVNKFAGAVGIGWYRVTSHAEEHQVLELQITHLGKLGIWISGFQVNLDRLLVTMREVVIDDAAVTLRHKGALLQLDLLHAWEAMGRGGDGWWSSEVNVKIYFRS